MFEEESWKVYSYNVLEMKLNALIFNLGLSIIEQVFLLFSENVELTI